MDLCGFDEEEEKQRQNIRCETTNDMTKANIPEQLPTGDELGLWVVNV